MSQTWAIGSIDPATTSPATDITRITDGLDSLKSNFSGVSLPATNLVGGMVALDTTNNVYWRRDPANTKWMLHASAADALVAAKSGAYTAVLGDFEKTLNCTGTWTLGFSAAATLTDGWWMRVINSGSGTITLDPNAAETINGAATLVLAAGDDCIIICDGSGFRTFRHAALAGSTSQTFSVSPATAATMAPAYSQLADGWVSDFATWTCTTAGVAGSLNANGSQNVAPVAAVFTVPGDQTATFGKGVKIKFTQTSVKYGYVKSATHAAGTTTVTLMENMDYQMTVAAISDNKFSFGSPADFPKEFAYLNPFVPTAGAPTTISSSGAFTMIGGLIRAWLVVTLTDIGTCTSYLNNLPIAALANGAEGSGHEVAAAGHFVGLRIYTANSALVYLQKYDGTFLVTNGHSIRASVVYTPI